MAKKKSPSSRAPRVKHRRRRSPLRRSAVPQVRRSRPYRRKTSNAGNKSEALSTSLAPATKVGFIYPNDPNAIFLDRMRALESKEFEAHAIYWHRASDLSHPCSTEPFSDDRFTKVTLPDPRAGVLVRLWLSLVFAWKIRQWVKRNDFPILHVVYPNMLIAAFLATLARRTEIVYDIWDVDYGRSMSWWNRTMYRILLSKTKQIFTTSEGFKQWITSNEIARKGTKITHISNAPFDLEASSPNTVPPTTQPASGPLVVGCVGNLRVPKQLKMLFEAQEEVRQTGRDLRIRLSGAGSRKQMVSSASAESDFIEYTGPFDFLRDGPKLYQALDVVFAVYPLEIYNYRVHVARRLHDSVRAATPIIVAKDSHMGDLVSKEKIGWQIGHESKDDLVKLLTYLYDNREQIARASHNTTLTKSSHSFAGYRQNYMAQYCELAGRKLQPNHSVEAPPVVQPKKSLRQNSFAPAY